MRKITKLMLTLALLIVGVGAVNATKLYADLSSSTATGNSTWDSSTKSFAWTAGSYAYMELKGLSGDLSEYTTLVVEAADYKASWRIDVELTDGSVLKGSDDGRSMAYWSANKKEITLSEKFTAAQLAAVKAIRISTNSDAGSVTINAAYIEKPLSLVFDENGVATIDKTDLKGEGYISYDDETGIVTSHYGEDGAASYGSLKVNLPLDGIDISNCDGFKVNYTGTAVIGTIQFANAADSWSQQFGNNPLGRDGVASYLVNATSLNTMYWFGNSTAGTMTISSAELHGNVIKANDPHYTELSKAMYHVWDGVGANANQTSDDIYFAQNYSVTGYNGLLYGNSNVSNTQYADLSDYDKLIFKGSGANLRVLINRDADNNTTELNPSFTDGKVEINIKDYAYFHLNAVKTTGDVTVSSMAVYKDDVAYSYVFSGSDVFTASAKAALADASATSIDATGITKATALTTANPNCLIVANEGMVTNGQNVIVDGTCANLVLTDQKPFAAPTVFTATAASFEKTVSGAATMVLPFSATIPEGATAYNLTEVSGSDITAENVTSITADAPVLLNGTGTFTFTGSDAAVAATGSEPVSNGLLRGVYATGYVPADSYVLQNGTDGLGFYKVATVETISVNPFRAYLTTPSGARALRIIYSQDATGISNLQTAGADDAVYSLSGVRVAQPTKGIFVKNGKKVVVK